MLRAIILQHGPLIVRIRRGSLLRQVHKGRPVHPRFIVAALAYDDKAGFKGPAQITSPKKQLSAAGEKDVRREVRRIMMQVEIAKRSPNPVQEFKKAAKNVNIHVVRRVYEELLRQSEWKLAVEAFDMLRMMPGYVANNELYSHIITLLGKYKQPKLAAEYFRELKLEGLRPDVSVCTAMIDAYGRSAMIREATDLFREMQQAKGAMSPQPNANTYTTLIRSLIAAGYLDRAVALFRDMELSGCISTVVTYNTMVEGLGKAGEIAAMEAMYSEMAERGLRPDLFTFHALIDAFGRAGEIEKMENTFVAMQEEGIAPNTITNNILMSSYGQWGQAPKAVRVFRNMGKLRCSPTVATYNILLKIYAAAGRAKDVDEIVKRMPGEGVRPDRSTFSILISALGNARKHARIEGALGRMRALHLRRDTSVYNAVIEAYAKGRFTHKMEAALAAMAEDGCRMDSRTFQSIVEAYARAGQLGAMERRLTEMRQAGFRPNLGMYTCMVGSYGRARRVEDVERLMAEMARSGCKTDLAFMDAVLGAYGYAGLLDKMEGVFKSLDFTPHEATFQIMMAAYARQGRMDKAESCLVSMRQAGLRPSVEIFNRLIGIYARARDVSQAEHWVGEMRANGLAPNGITFALLAQARDLVPIFKSGSRTYTALMSVDFGAESATSDDPDADVAGQEGLAQVSADCAVPGDIVENADRWKKAPASSEQESVESSHAELDRPGVAEHAELDKPGATGVVVGGDGVRTAAALLRMSAQSFDSGDDDAKALVLQWLSEVGGGRFQPFVQLLKDEFRAGEPSSRQVSSQVEEEEEEEQDDATCAAALELLAAVSQSGASRPACLALTASLLEATWRLGRRWTSRQIVSFQASPRFHVPAQAPEAVPILHPFVTDGRVWEVSLVGLPQNASEAVLLCWLRDAQERLKAGAEPLPAVVAVLLGRAEKTSREAPDPAVQGPLWQAPEHIQALLLSLGSPFQQLSKNPWRVEAEGETFRDWVLSGKVGEVLSTLDVSKYGRSDGEEVRGRDGGVVIESKVGEEASIETTAVAEGL